MFVNVCYVGGITSKLYHFFLSRIVMQYSCWIIKILSLSVTIQAKQKQPGCKKSARPIRSHNGYKRPKTLISSKAKKLNILLRILLLE